MIVSENTRVSKNLDSCLKYEVQKDDILPVAKVLYIHLPNQGYESEMGVRKNAACGQALSVSQ